MKNIIFYCLLIFLASCNSVNYVKIDTRIPAQITIPSTAGTVAIINNAAVQPSSIGHTKLVDDTETSVKVSADSLNIILAEALVQFVEEEKFYDNVVLYDTPLRTDSLFTTEVFLAPKTVNDILTETGADVIFSIDRIKFNSNRYTVLVNEEENERILSVEMEAWFRVYNPESKQTSPVVYTDSIYWKRGPYRGYVDTLPDTREALKYIVLRAADKTSLALVPSWRKDERWYYSDATIGMKRASVKASANEWNEALAIWTELYEKEKGAVKKAKLSINITLANEMLDDVESSMKWIDNAIENFVLAKRNEDDNDLKLARVYKKALEKREADFKKLDIQIGSDK